MAAARPVLALALLPALASLSAIGPASADAAATTVHHDAHGSTQRIGLSSARSLGRPGPCAKRLRGIRARRRQSTPRQRRLVRRRLRRALRRCRRVTATRSSQSAGLPLYWGATIGDQITGTQAPWDMNAVAAFEQTAGKPVSLVNFFAPFANCGGPSCHFYDFPTEPMESIREHGAIPVYSWSSQSIPSQQSEPDFQLSDTISGRYDAYIQRFAEDARDWGHPFFLRFNWEMNGNWFPWMEGTNGNQPGEYVAAWRHVHDIFTAVGANNVTWVWCPNVDPSGTLGDLASLYPGDRYVDWTGLDGYNWGRAKGGWADFGSLYSSTYHAIADSLAPTKPMMIGEMGSSESGGSKAEWIRGALAAIPAEYPQIRGMLWFDKFDDGMDWPIESSPAAAGAFAAGVQDPAYRGNEYGNLPAGPIPPRNDRRGPVGTPVYTPQLDRMAALGRTRPRNALPARVAPLAVAILMLAVAAASSAPAYARAEKVRVYRHQEVHARHFHQRPAYWGAWIADGSAEDPPWNMAPVSDLQARVGKGLSLLGLSSPFADCDPAPCRFYDFPTAAMENARQYGAIPVFSWSSQESSSTPSLNTVMPDFQLSDVVAGRYDGYIARFATDARNWGHPFFLRFNWEMNGDWFPWSEQVNGNAPGEYVAAWRHVHDIFTAVGATNATWVWCPFAEQKRRFAPLGPLYPGTDYVDWTCMDGFNWGSNPTNPHRWASFSAIFSRTYRQLVRRVAPDKPILLAEFASTGSPRAKARWINRMFRDLATRYRRIRGLLWYEQVDRGIDWPLSSSPRALGAFARGISKPVFRANVETSPASPIAPPG